MQEESQQSTSTASTAIPYESIPELAANEDFIALMEKARNNKRDLERLEAEQDEIRLQCGAMAAVAGVKSVAFFELVLTNVDGGVTKGKITGAGLIEQVKSDPLNFAKYAAAIAMAAKDCDPEVLLQHGFPAHLIEPARSKGTTRAASTQFSWAGAKGKGGKRRAAGSGGSVQ